MRQLIFAAVLAAFFMATPQAHGQRNCEQRAVVLDFMWKTHGERPVAVGVMPGGTSAIELFATSDGEKWSLVLTGPNGLSCLMAVGEAWQPIYAKFGIIASNEGGE